MYVQTRFVIIGVLAQVATRNLWGYNCFNMEEQDDIGRFSGDLEDQVALLAGLPYEQTPKFLELTTKKWELMVDLPGGENFVVLNYLRMKYGPMNVVSDVYSGVDYIWVKKSPLGVIAGRIKPYPVRRFDEQFRQQVLTLLI